MFLIYISLDTKQPPLHPFSPLRNNFSKKPQDFTPSPLKKGHLRKCMTFSVCAFGGLEGVAPPLQSLSIHVDICRYLSWHIRIKYMYGSGQTLYATFSVSCVKKCTAIKSASIYFPRFLIWDFVIRDFDIRDLVTNPNFRRWWVMFFHNAEAILIFRYWTQSTKNALHWVEFERKR